MKISLNWIKDFVDLPTDLSSDDFSTRVTLSTVEVEEVIDRSKNLDGVVVGELIEINKHPNADKLSVAKVDIGAEKNLQIVFGQMVQMEVGCKVPVAVAPTKLPGNVEIRRSKLRQVESEGMLCLDQEMGLADEGATIRFFDKETKNGTPIIEALGLNDVVLDIDNKSMTHRPDLWGHYGMAREVAAIYKQPLKKFDPPAIKGGRDYKLDVKVDDPENCPRYMGVVLDNINIGPSPKWMQDRLIAVGMRPVNNIVDVTNYVLLELGQPMHAFDVSKLESSAGEGKSVEINVKAANDGAKFTTLDDEERELDESMLMICDGVKEVAVAGIIGGTDSEISDSTATILLESANFDATNIRKTAQKLGVRTESSARFEKSLDPNMCEQALNRAVELILQMIPKSRVASQVVDVKKFKLNQGPIELSLDFLAAKMGTRLPDDEVVGTLERLGFDVKKKGNTLNVKVPTWRATKDVSIAEDLVEEVARVYGYDNIATDLPFIQVVPPEVDPLRKLSKRVRQILAWRFAATEVYNYSFVNPVTIDRMGLEVKDHVELANPLSKERPYLRRSLATNLAENIEKNQGLFDTIRMFEIGKTYIAEKPGLPSTEGGDLLPLQEDYLGIVFSEKGDQSPLVEVKKIIFGLLDELGLDYSITQAPEGEAWIHPGRHGQIILGKQEVGYFAEVNPVAQKDLGLDSRTAIVEINLSQLVGSCKDIADYQRAPEFPEVKRDLAFTIDKTTVYQEVYKSIAEVTPILQEVELFDVYEGEGVDEGQKSFAIHLAFRDSQKTLESAEVDKVMEKIVNTLKKKFNAEIRE